MKDERKTKKQLVSELAELRQRIAELEASETERQWTEAASRESQEGFRGIFENATIGLYRTTPDGRILMANPALVSMLGYSSFGELSQRNLEENGYEPEYPRSAFRRRLESEGQVIGLESAWVRRDGTTLFVRESARALRDEDGNTVYYEGTVEDITDRKRAEEALQEYSEQLEEMVEERTADLLAANRQLQEEITERERAEEALRKSEDRFRQFFENEPAYCYMISPEGLVLDVNSAALKTLGYQKEELVGKPLKTIYAPESLPGVEELFAKWKEAGELKDEEIVIITREGNRRTVLLSANAVKDKGGTILHSVSVQQDITERKRAEETIQRLAYYDPLTGLPNRTLFNDRLAMALTHARRNQGKLAVMLLDLDHFKDINDTLGHTVGDELLQDVGERLTTLLRESDTVSRMGGDEFLLLLPEIARVEDVRKVAGKVLEAIGQPVVIAGCELGTTASIGIAIYPDDGEDADTLLKNADIAMYHAKEAGRDNYQRYTQLERR